MTEYDKIVVLAVSPMLLVIVIGMIWDLVDWIKHKYRKRGSMSTKRNCQFCKYYKDGYCENLELKPCYPEKGCGDFVVSPVLPEQITVIEEQLKELFERIENIEKQIKEDKEERLKKLKAEIDYAKFSYALSKTKSEE